MVMVAIESGDGIIQSLDNHLSKGESGAWSLIIYPLVLVSAGLIYGFIAYIVGKFAAKVRKQKLLKIARQIKGMESRRHELEK